MSLYKYNITVKVDDEDDKYNEMTNICDKLEKENNCMLTSFTGGLE